VDSVPDFSRYGTRLRVLMSLLLLFSLTGNASANAGTPLIWTGMLHLFFGNLMIGVFEGHLLAGFFRLRQQRAVFIMILANYASAWSAVGLMTAGWWDEDLLNLDNVRWVFCAMIATAWALTVVIEWPFVWFCFRGEPKAWRRSLKASLLVQTISYVVMMAWYWFVSGTSLLTGATMVKQSDFHLPDQMEIYYIDPADGDVYRRAASGGEREKVFDMNSNSSWDQLFVTPMTDDRHTDLKARLVRSEPAIDLASGLAVRDLPSADRPKDRDMWFNFGKAAKLAVPAESEWEFETGFWGSEGLEATNRKRGHTVGLSLETPFVIWHARNAVHLANDLVLFQLGTNQICVFDPATRRIARLWYGRGFVAVIPRKE
jgi:hypothetical protein